QIYAREHRDRIKIDVQTMGSDIVDRINRYGIDSQRFRDEFLYQHAGRQLNESAILRIDANGRVRSDIIEVNFDNRPLASRFPAAVLRAMRAGDLRFASTPNRVEAVVRLDPQALVYLYGARAVSPDA